MKKLTFKEIGFVYGGSQSQNITSEETGPSWKQSKLDQRQWSTIAGMTIQALIAHHMPDGPAKSAANIAGFALISVVCNTVFSVL